jgi:uncharacterized membrane protein YgcG
MDSWKQTVIDCIAQLRAMQAAQYTTLNVCSLIQTVSDCLLQRNSLTDAEVDELRLAELPDVLIKSHFATESAKQQNDSQNYSGYNLKRAVCCVANAAFLSPKFCTLFYQRCLTPYLLSMLARSIDDLSENEQEFKSVDARNCLICIGNAMRLEARVCEQVQMHLGMQVVSKYLNSANNSLAIETYAFCAHLINDPTGNELQVPDHLLQYLLQQLKRRLSGQDIVIDDMNNLASGLLRRLQKLILCSDDFNSRVMQLGIVDVLVAVLSADEPSDCADTINYWHPKTDNLDAVQYSTFLEKQWAARSCWALLLSEQHFAAHAQAMAANQHLLLALQTAGTRNSDVKLVTDGVLWQLKQLPTTATTATTATTTTTLNTATATSDEHTPHVPDTPRLNRDKQTPSRLRGSSARLTAPLTDTIDTTDTSNPTSTTATNDTPKHTKPVSDVGTGSSSRAGSARVHSATKHINVNQQLSSGSGNGSTGSGIGSVNGSSSGSGSGSGSGDQKVQLVHGGVTVPNKDVKDQVMISYTNQYKSDLVFRINKSLQQAGLTTWIYTEKMAGDMYTAMATAIEQSAVVLVCYSTAYSNSDPCHAELNYARYCNKPTVLVRLEEFNPFGWLGNLKCISSD